MEGKDLEAEALGNKVVSKTEPDRCLADLALNPTLGKEVCDGDAQIEEILEGFLQGKAGIKEGLVCGLEASQAVCGHGGVVSDMEVERVRSRQNITVVIPSTDLLPSSPNITFGQTTLSMVDEFMASESPRRRAIGKIRKSRKSLLGRLFFCC